jgi:hypothetical protein
MKLVTNYDLKFNEEKHRYTLGNVKLDSVTQIIDSVGARIESENGDQSFKTIASMFNKNEQAADFGNAFHQIVSWLDQGLTVNYDPAMEPWVNQFRKFRNEYLFGSNVEIIAQEQPMCNGLLKYAGTADLIEIRSGVRYIWDWKTSTTWCKHWDIQLAAYRDLVIHNYGLRSNVHIKCMVVRFDKDKFEVRDVFSAKAQNHWKSILNVYRMVR